MFGEPNDVGSEFREVGAAAGRWLYVVGSYSNNHVTLLGSASYSPIIAQGPHTRRKTHKCIAATNCHVQEHSPQPKSQLGQ